MIEIKLGDRYAKSIYLLAKEKGEVEKVKADFLLIELVCNQNPELVNMLRSPLIFSDKKQAILNKIFSGKLSPITQKLIEIIVRKKREPWLLDIAMRFLVKFDAENNITRGFISSAHPLPAEMKEKIKSLVEQGLKTSFIFEEKIDSELIGGFVLRIGDIQFDGSIANGLRKLEKDFRKNLYVGEFDVDIV